MRRRSRGVVLIAVLFILLLAISAVTLFLRRAAIDGRLIGNQDYSARAEGLARGGVRLAMALVIEDRLAEEQRAFRVDALDDAWAQARATDLNTPDGGTLRLTIEDAGARLDLNALFDKGAPKDPATEPYLIALLTKIAQEIPETAEQHDYDPEELAHNLIDYVDADEEKVKGGAEDEPYQERDPPSKPANRALLSVDELGLVEGFDAALVEALRPYVSVFPIHADGINVNTAPPWVLALLYTGTSGAYELVSEDDVRRILETRESGSLLCADEVNQAGCTPLREILPDTVYPPPTFTSDVFFVRADAQYGSTLRSVSAVIDRSQLAKPALLAISVR